MYIAPFYVGQIIVCVHPSPAHGLFKGREYQVKDIVRCGCGNWLISWGETFPKKGTGKMRCTCKNLLTANRHEYYCTYKRFAPKNEKLNLITFKEILENEKECVLFNN